MRTGMAGFLAVAMLVLAMPDASAELMSDERRQQLCAEAQERYAGMDIDKPEGPGHDVVLLYKYNFCPRNKTVKKGTAVHFINVDKRTSHSVWFKEAGEEESPRFFPEEAFMMKFDIPGEYPYLCGPHWKQEGMRGTLTVTD